MNRARAAALVLLDASPFYRFCEAQLLPSLAEYLRRNARVTPEVATELRRGARSSRHTGLRYLELAGWPPETAALPAELQRPFLDYSRAARQNDELPSKHAGELTAGDGYRVFDLSTPPEAGRADFTRACDRAGTTRD
jgi:hypothetical protein